MKFGAREFLFFSLLILILAGGWLAVFKKIDSRRTDLRTSIAQKEASLENLRKNTAGIEDIGKEIDELRKAIAFFENKLPQEKEMDAIVTQVWQMAQSNNLDCKSIKPLKPQRGERYSEQQIDLLMSGDFAGFYNFLLQLEKLPRITRLQQMNLQKIASEDGQMTAKVTMCVFFEPETGGDRNNSDPRPGATVTTVR